MAKEGSTIGGLMDSFGTAISMSLQYGVPLEVLVNKFSHSRFEPMGYTTNPDIRIAKSVVDYIFRFMGISFLAGYREATNGQPPQKQPEKGNGDSQASGENGSNGNGTNQGNGDGSSGDSGQAAESSDVGVDYAVLERAGVLQQKDDGQQGQFANFQTDAPICDNCGSITVRSGNCYLCHNCGNSLGCS
jgi:ribonucleoside-diphosphate reductase alpha chain